MQNDKITSIYQEMEEDDDKERNRRHVSGFNDPWAPHRSDDSVVYRTSDGRYER